MAPYEACARMQKEVFRREYVYMRSLDHQLLMLLMATTTCAAEWRFDAYMYVMCVCMFSVMFVYLDVYEEAFAEV